MNCSLRVCVDWPGWASARVQPRTRPAPDRPLGLFNFAPCPVQGRVVPDSYALAMEEDDVAPSRLADVPDELAVDPTVERWVDDITAELQRVRDRAAADALAAGPVVDRT